MKSQRGAPRDIRRTVRWRAREAATLEEAAAIEGATLSELIRGGALAAARAILRDARRMRKSSTYERRTVSAALRTEQEAVEDGEAA